MKLEIALDSREHAILVCDEDHNDIAEFYHSDHATVEQSYETALMLARRLVEAVNGRAFYGAECPSYPSCSGGCGLGCTHEIEASRAAAKARPSQPPIPCGCTDEEWRDCPVCS